MWRVMLLLCAGSVWAADGPSLFYSKSFPGSVPAYAQITVDRSGAVEYKEAPDDDFLPQIQAHHRRGRQRVRAGRHPGALQEPDRIGAEGRLHGQEDLPMGERRGEGRAAVQLLRRYPGATAPGLVRAHVRIGAGALDLEKAAKYDRLGVDKTLRQMWSAMDRKRLVGLEQYLPMLDRIANNDSYMHTARAKAAEMAETIRKPAGGAVGAVIDAETRRIAENTRDERSKSTGSVQGAFLRVSAPPR